MKFYFNSEFLRAEEVIFFVANLFSLGIESSTDDVGFLDIPTCTVV